MADLRRKGAAVGILSKELCFCFKLSVYHILGSASLLSTFPKRNEMSRDKTFGAISAGQAVMLFYFIKEYRQMLAGKAISKLKE